MDHVVYLDSKAAEMEKLYAGKKTMIIRGAAGRKMPYGRVFEGDVLYLLENDGSGLIKAKAEVRLVLNSEKMDPEQSLAMVKKYQKQLVLTEPQIKRWAGKRYLVFIEIFNLEEVEPFTIDKSSYGNMDDWLPVEEIQSVR